MSSLRTCRRLLRGRRKPMLGGVLKGDSAGAGLFGGWRLLLNAWNGQLETVLMALGASVVLLGALRGEEGCLADSSDWWHVI